MRQFWVSVAVILAATATATDKGASAADSPIVQRAARPPVLASLDAIGDLRAAFNRDAGTTRLVLLLSPT